MSKVRIQIVGDMWPADPSGAHSPAYFTDGLKGVLGADILAGNLECVLVPEGTAINAAQWPKALWAPEAAADALKAAGFHIVWLANNHILDLGPQGILDTKRLVEQRGILTAGGGAEPAEARKLRVIERKGVRVGFLAYAENCPQLAGRRRPGPAYNLMPEMEADVTAARPQVDVLVVAVHADLEFLDYPSRHRMAYSRRLAALGVDLLIEGHPHVPQGIERQGRSLIAYGMGNCMFKLGDYMQGGSPWTAESFVLEVTASREGIGEHRIIPFKIAEVGRPEPLAGADRDRFMDHFTAISADLSDPVRMAGHDREMVRRYLDIYTNWMWGAYQKGGVDALLNDYLPRFFMEEGAYWAQETARMARENMPKWEELTSCAIVDSPFEEYP
ncbi:MAG: CapA family protein [Planctomycetota bacterium]